MTAFDALHPLPKGTSVKVIDKNNTGMPGLIWSCDPPIYTIWIFSKVSGGKQPDSELVKYSWEMWNIKPQYPNILGFWPVGSRVQISDGFSGNAVGDLSIGDEGVVTFIDENDGPVAYRVSFDHLNEPRGRWMWTYSLELLQDSVVTADLKQLNQDGRTTCASCSTTLRTPIPHWPSLNYCPKCES